MNASNLIAAIGNFDGVHRGHVALIERIAAIAGESGARAGAVVFDPHPRRYFRPADPPFLITTSEARNALLAKAGAHAVLPLVFDGRLAALSPEEFVRDVLKRDLKLAGVAVGGDFRFGAGRAGDAEGLSRLCTVHGISAHVMEPLAEKGHSDKIGSTAIREAILSGAVDRAADMLGRFWRVEGVIEPGNKVGRTLGFATANMTLGELIEPRRGVYAVRAQVEGEWFDGVANFGRRPTVGAPAPLLETHLFAFSRDIYGKSVGVEFIRFIRDEMKFSGLDALKAQIAEDCVAAKRALG
ncbi:MAG: riboflavin biosynthesis protein RibF [Pseudomonadota bacterium]